MIRILRPKDANLMIKQKKIYLINQHIENYIKILIINLNYNLAIMYLMMNRKLLIKLDSICMVKQ